MQMNVLSVSDRVAELIYSPSLCERFGNAHFVISCGDLPNSYLEYIVSALNKPLFFVHGNHDEVSESGKTPNHPQGADNLHQRVLTWKGITLAGVEGSIRYSAGLYQYTQFEMWLHALSLAPKLYYNRYRYGRALDIFISHAPAAGVQDRKDWTHQGVKAFRWLLETFQPAYHFHGHVHLYGPNVAYEASLGRTRVINAYNYRQVVINF